MNGTFSELLDKAVYDGGQLRAILFGSLWRRKSAVSKGLCERRTLGAHALNCPPLERPRGKVPWPNKKTKKTTEKTAFGRAVAPMRPPGHCIVRDFDLAVTALSNGSNESGARAPGHFLAEKWPGGHERTAGMTQADG